jgi:hypothetical protein
MSDQSTNKRPNKKNTLRATNRINRLLRFSRIGFAAAILQQVSLPGIA